MKVTVSHGGQARTLSRSGTLRVGRSADCDVSVDAPTVSRLHLIVALDDETVTCVDQSSTGTYLDGVRLTVPFRLSPNTEARRFSLGSPDGPVVLVGVHASDQVARASRRWLVGTAVVVCAALVASMLWIRDRWDTDESRHVTTTDSADGTETESSSSTSQVGTLEGDGVDLLEAIEEAISEPSANGELVVAASALAGTEEVVGELTSRRLRTPTEWMTGAELVTELEIGAVYQHAESDAALVPFASEDGEDFGVAVITDSMSIIVAPQSRGQAAAVSLAVEGSARELRVRPSSGGESAREEVSSLAQPERAPASAVSLRRADPRQADPPPFQCVQSSSSYSKFADLLDATVREAGLYIDDLEAYVRQFTPSFNESVDFAIALAGWLELYLANLQWLPRYLGWRVAGSAAPVVVEIPMVVAEGQAFGGLVVAGVEVFGVLVAAAGALWAWRSIAESVLDGDRDELRTASDHIELSRQASIDGSRWARAIDVVRELRIALGWIDASLPILSVDPLETERRVFNFRVCPEWQAPVALDAVESVQYTNPAPSARDFLTTFTLSRVAAGNDCPFAPCVLEVATGRVEFDVAVTEPGVFVGTAPSYPADCYDEEYGLAAAGFYDVTEVWQITTFFSSGKTSYEAKVDYQAVPSGANPVLIPDQFGPDGEPIYTECLGYSFTEQALVGGFDSRMDEAPGRFE